MDTEVAQFMSTIESFFGANEMVAELLNKLSDAFALERLRVLM